MLDKFILKNVKVSSIYAQKGNYEGNDYFQAIAELDNGMKLKTKLTRFEFETLKGLNK